MNENLTKSPIIHLQAAAKKVAAGAVAATAIATMGFLAMPAPAQASPACSQWGFPGLFALSQTVWNETVSFNATGPNANGARAEANDGEYQGTVTGGITGDNVDFTIPWRGRGAPDDAPLLSRGRYQGSVGTDGFVHGETHDELANDHSHWDSTVPLLCITPAVPAAGPSTPAPHTTVVQKAPDVQLPNIELAPPSATPAPPKTLQGPTVSATPGLTGVTFHVTDRSGVASQCTYSSEGFTSNSFSLPANGSFDLLVPAVRQFRTRTGTITCDNGTTAPTSVFF